MQRDLESVEPTKSDSGRPLVAATACAVTIVVVAAANTVANLLAGSASIGFVVSAAAAGGAFFALVRFAGESMYLSALLAFTASLASGPGYADYVTTRDAPRVRGLSVRHAPDHPAAATFVFADPRVLADRVGGHVESHHDKQSNRRSVHRWYVAPLVPEDWEVGEEIPAWCTCGEDSIAACTRALSSGDLPHGAVVLRALQEKYRLAVTDALTKHDLREAEHAPVVKLVEDPEAEVRERLQIALLATAVPLVVFVLVMAGARAYRWLRSRRT